MRRQELEAELATLEGDLVRYLERAPSPEIALEGGVLRLVQEAGTPPALVWQEKDRVR